MTKYFNLQYNEKFCFFVTKDKKASYYFDDVLHRGFTGFDNKSSLVILKIIKDVGVLFLFFLYIYIYIYDLHNIQKKTGKHNHQIP